MFNLLPALILLLLQAPGSSILEPGQPAWKSVIGAQALADADADSLGANDSTAAGTTSLSTLLRWCAFIALLGEEFEPETDVVPIETGSKSAFSAVHHEPTNPGFLTPGRTRDGPVLA